MGLRNTSTSYGRMSIALHWIMALMVIGVVCVGLYMTGMEKGPEKWEIYGLHKSTGVVILAIALFRWFWTLTSPKVSPLESYSKLQTALAHAMHWMLMLMLLLMPLSGLLMSAAGGRATSVYGLFSIPGFSEANKSLAGTMHDIHVFSGKALAVLIALHILFALKHQFFNKDSTVARMLGRSE